LKRAASGEVTCLRHADAGGDEGRDLRRHDADAVSLMAKPASSVQIATSETQSRPKPPAMA
jgi:hypothetical protein